MKDRFFFGTLIFIVLLSCGADDIEPEPPVKFVAVTPPSGSAIGANRSITITFDGEAEDVQSNFGTVEVVGKSVIVYGPFSPGNLKLIVTWKDGRVEFEYYATAPCAPCD